MRDNLAPFKKLLTDSSDQTIVRGRVIQFVLLLCIFLVYLGSRILAWGNAPLLEDHDSLVYLNNIKAFLTFDFQEIIALSPDSTPFYPFFGALCSLLVGSIETGARLCSLVFSSLLFVSIIGIGKRIAGPIELGIGLVILALSPVLIHLHFMPACHVPL